MFTLALVAYLDYSCQMNVSSSYRGARIALCGLVLAVHAFSPLVAEELYSPTWGFYLDLPEGFEYAAGDGKNRFSFMDPDSGISVDVIAYAGGRYSSPENLGKDVVKRLLAEADTALFDYRGRRAAITQLAFSSQAGPVEGWALALELGGLELVEGKRPLLLALAYGAVSSGADATRPNAEHIMFSALDSIAVSAEDRLSPGPVSVFSWPPSERTSVSIQVAGRITQATLDADDARAAKALVDREFKVLVDYNDSPKWKEAWARFYRAIWRDAYSRLADISFVVERAISEHAISESPATMANPGTDGAASGRMLAEGVLGWIQGFKYERDLLGSDFVDLPSTAAETRGDCDSRALLLAIILQHANIDAILMVSREYGHAMAAIAVDGPGARFSHGGADWIVAETTAKVGLGMIGQNVADPQKWLAIDFPALPKGR